MGNYAAKSGNPEAIKQAIIYALDGWGRSHGGTLKLYGDISLDGIKFEGSDETALLPVTYPNATHIDLNGNKITRGMLTLDKGDDGRGVNVTITDSSAGKTGPLCNVTVNRGAGLVVDGVSVGQDHRRSHDRTDHAESRQQVHGVCEARWNDAGPVDRGRGLHIRQCRPHRYREQQREWQLCRHKGSGNDCRKP